MRPYDAILHFYWEIIFKNIIKISNNLKKNFENCYYSIISLNYINLFNLFDVYEFEVNTLIEGN